MNDVWSLADKINTGLLFLTALGVYAAFRQIKAGEKAQRAIFLKDLYIQLRTDEAVAEAFYLIEYSEFVYDQNFHGSPLEKKVDRLLTLIDLVCEMRSQQIITEREMEFFRYQFRRVAADPAIREYLNFLDMFYKEVGMQRRAFPAFQDFAQVQLKLPRERQHTPPSSGAPARAWWPSLVDRLARTLEKKTHPKVRECCADPREEKP